MLCDSCTKVKVCKFKENCNILERDVAGSKIENIITLETKCSERETVALYRDANTMAQMQVRKQFNHELTV